MDTTDAARATPQDVRQASAARGSRRPLINPDWATALTYCLVVYLCVRIALFVLGLLTVSLVPMQTPVDVPGWPAQPQTGGWHNAVTAWERSDAMWFLRIASTGYRADDSSAAFFPLFPMLVRAVAWLTGGRFLLAGFLVSNLALFSGLVVLFKLTAEEFGARMARRTVLYLCLFPTAFFLFSPFSESLFFALAVGCVYAARHRHWVLAGGLGAGAALTRSLGIVMCAVLAAEAVHQLLDDRRVQRWTAPRTAGVLAACALPALGTASYLAYWQWRGSGWAEPFHAQGSWDRHVATPWHTLIQAFRFGTDNLGAYPGGYWTVDLLLAAVAFALAGWVAVQCRPSYAVYAWLSLLLPLSLVFEGRPLMSVPRFLLPIFPIFWGLARFSERWKAHDLVVGVSAAGLCLLGVLSTSWLPIF